MSRPKLKRNLCKTSFHCDTDLVAALDSVARAWGMSRNQLIVNMLREGLPVVKAMKPFGVLRRRFEDHFSDAGEVGEPKSA